MRDTKIQLPPQLSEVLRLIEEGRLGEARAGLEQCTAEPNELLELVQLKLSVAASRLEPGSALQKVIGILRQEPRHPLAMQLYQEFSLREYHAGNSCPSHSHPPPARR